MRGCRIQVKNSTVLEPKPSVLYTYILLLPSALSRQRETEIAKTNESTPSTTETRGRHSYIRPPPTYRCVPKVQRRNNARNLTVRHAARPGSATRSANAPPPIARFLLSSILRPSFGRNPLAAALKMRKALLMRSRNSVSNVLNGSLMVMPRR